MSSIGNDNVDMKLEAIVIPVSDADRDRYAARDRVHSHAPRTWSQSNPARSFRNE